MAGDSLNGPRSSLMSGSAGSFIRRSMWPWSPGVLSVVLLAAVLRLYDLGSQLWLDEIAALAGMRRPLRSLLTEWPESAYHALYAILARLSISLFGESAYAVRLPAAVFGVAGVAALFLFADRVFGRKTALLVSGLFAVSYHHVFYSQDARGYTALIFFFLVASYFLVRFWEEATITRGPGFLYATSLVLGAYSHPFGVFILPAHVLTLFGAYVLSRKRAHEQAFPLWTYLVYVILAGLVSIILYAPFVPSMLEMAAQNAAMAGAGPRLGFWLFQEVLEGLSAAFFGPVGVLAGMAVGILGLSIWLRRGPFSLAVLLVPILLEAVTFVAVGFGIHPRYFAIALPTVYLLGGQALIAVIEGTVMRLPVGATWRRRAEATALVAVVVVSAYPLARYYTYPKQDFRGALELLSEVAAPGDLRVGLKSAAYALNNRYAANVIRVNTLEELQAVETKDQPIWIVSSLERIVRAADPELYEHVTTNYDLVARFPGTVGDGAVKLYTRRTP